MTPNPRRRSACPDSRLWIEAAVFVGVVCRLDLPHALLALALMSRIAPVRADVSAPSGITKSDRDRDE
jgi:hypothetical protein